MIEFVDPPDETWPLGSWGWGADCPCGTSEYRGYGRATHTRWHMDWATGLHVPVSLECQAPLARVTGDSPMPDRKTAYRLGQLMRREEGYDFCLLPDPVTWKVHQRWPVAYLALWRERAIGLLIVGQVKRWGWNKPDAEGYVHFDQREPSRAVAGIFVCANYRRRGVGRRLVELVAERERVARDEFAWLMPLSDGGNALAASVAGDGLRLCNSVPWE